MEGADAQVQDRLRAISATPHWRNVFLFAAGKCFAERQFLRDTIITICEQLNDAQSDPLQGHALVGSKLALDLLEDGLTREQPKYGRSLLRLALRLLELPEIEASHILARRYHDESKELYLAAVRNAAGMGNRGYHSAVWTLLLRLKRDKVEWAEAEAEKFMPGEAEHQFTILSQSPSSDDPWTHNMIAQVIPRLAPWQVRLPVNLAPLTPEWLHNAVRMDLASSESTTDVSYKSDQEVPELKLRITRLTTECDVRLHSFLSMPKPSKDWLPIIASAKFAVSPSKETLADALEMLANEWDPRERLTRYEVPWPISACISWATTTSELCELARNAREGKMGSIEDWLEAQVRWERVGLRDSDFLSAANEWPFGSKISEAGFAFAASDIGNFVEHSAVYKKLYDIYSLCPRSPMKSWCADVCLRIAESFFQPLEKLEIQPATLKELLENRSFKHVDFNLFRKIELPNRLNPSWIGFFDWLGHFKQRTTIDLKPPEFTHQLVAAYRENPSRTGLYLVIGSCAMSGAVCNLTTDEHPPPSDPLDPLNESSLFIRLSRGAWDFDEAQDLTNRLLKLEPNRAPVELIIQTVENAPITLEDRTRLLVTMWMGSREVRPNFLPALYQAMKQQLQARKSGLAEPTRWSALGLPPIN
jgi:hypothetical protein